MNFFGFGISPEAEEAQKRQTELLNQRAEVLYWSGTVVKIPRWCLAVWSFLRWICIAWWKISRRWGKK